MQAASAAGFGLLLATPMNFVSLFSGIGGLDLGLERAGMTCVAQVEIDDYCNQILEKHWPDVPRWRDIHDINEGDLSDADLICGGFPCQPVSVAGRREGANDPRWLWPEFHRIIRLVRPRIVLVENVPGLLTSGFGEVASDLADSGYDLEWTRLSAASVGAPHLRDRIFLVAHVARASSTVPDTERDAIRLERQRGGQQHRQSGPSESRSTGQIVADAHGLKDGGLHPGRQNGRTTAQPARHGEMADTTGEGLEERGPDTRSRPRLERSSWWAVEPDVGRVAHGIPRRVDRLRGLGNAVVPQVAEYIGRLIMENA